MARNKIAYVLSILLGAFILFTSGRGPFEILIQRSIFVALIVCLGLAVFPLFKGSRFATLGVVIDGILAIVSVAACLFVTRDHALIMEELPNAAAIDIALTTILLLTVLDLCRRTVGWAFTIIVLVALGYSALGHLIPGQFGHKYFDMQFLTETLYLSDLGIWGSLTGIGATFVGVFIMFGTTLLYTGGGQTFVNIASYLGGKRPGGAAKIAVIASGIFGMMSGNSVGNVATTGNVTIPMMKRLGYPSALAGAIEAVASTGGQFTPPILSAVAFVIAEALGITYWQVAISATGPAILFYLSLYSMIHIYAIRMKLGKIDSKNLPSRKESLSWAHLLPLAAGVCGLVFGVVKGNSIVYSVFQGIVGVLGVFLIVKIKSGMGLKGSIASLVEVLEQTGRGLVMVGILLIGAQVLVSLINITGIAGTLSSIIVALAGNSVLVLALITAIVCFVMGMGLPTLPAYVLVAAVLVPPMIKLGVDPLCAHMFVLYYACLSAITPPVCAAVFVAAGIANTSWLGIAKYAVKLGLVTYFLPIMFIYFPGLLGEGGWQSSLYGIFVGLMVTIGTVFIVGRQRLTGKVAVDRFLAAMVIALALFNEIYTFIIALILTVILVIVARKQNLQMQNEDQQILNDNPMKMANAAGGSSS